jgi:hypothetical protein
MKKLLINPYPEYRYDIIFVQDKTMKHSFCLIVEYDAANLAKLYLFHGWIDGFTIAWWINLDEALNNFSNIKSLFTYIFIL